MMKLCEWSGTCQAWAQWRAVYPDKTVRRLCQQHKEEHQREKGAVDVKYIFMGTEPDGIDDTKS
jgi:hypothetical protein